MSEHTPGPWSIDKPVRGKYPIREGQGGYLIATVWPDDSGREYADARLIAAAPSLHRELAHLVRLLEPVERAGGLDVPGLATLNGARAALAKVEGEMP